jgi:hypothetical protein
MTARGRNESPRVRTNETRTDITARSVSRSHDNINTDNKYGVLGRDKRDDEDADASVMSDARAARDE